MDSHIVSVISMFMDLSMVYNESTGYGQHHSPQPMNINIASSSPEGHSHQHDTQCLHGSKTSAWLQVAADHVHTNSFWWQHGTQTSTMPVATTRPCSPTWPTLCSSIDHSHKHGFWWQPGRWILIWPPSLAQTTDLASTVARDLDIHMNLGLQPTGEVNHGYQCISGAAWITEAF